MDGGQYGARGRLLALASGGMGATTVSATLWAAAALGIEVMATGGIGGVHPRTGDVSADLLEIARLPGMVVCAGPKSIVDPAATLERLEELGVLVVGYGCDRLPFFLARDAGLALEHRVDTAAEAAGLVRARARLGVESAVLLCNPIYPDHALDAAVVAQAVAECERRAAAAGVSGKAVTPFLLSCLAEVTRVYTFGFAAVFLLLYNLPPGLVPGQSANDLFWLGSSLTGWLVLIALVVGPTIGG